MIDLALDPSETRPLREPAAPRARRRGLRVVLLGLAGAGLLGGFGVAASSLMAGLAAPPRIPLAPPGRAADWPELKDGLPALAETAPVKPGIEAARTKPEQTKPDAPALRMAALTDSPAALPPPARVMPEASSAPVRSVAVAAPEPPTKRIPNPVPVAPIGPARQAVVLRPARTAALQPPRPAETVRAREVAEPAAVRSPTPAAVTAVPAAPPEKAPRKAVAARKAPLPAHAQVKPGDAAPQAPVAQTAEAEETEVLGIKLPSLAPAGRKLKEGVDALGDAVKSVF